MELHISLHVGVHIEHESTRTLVQAILWAGGHQSLPDEAQARSLYTYLETILEDQQHRASPPYDLLIISGDDNLWRRNSTPLIALIERLSLWPLPLLVLTDVDYSQIKEIAHHHAHVAFLPRSPLMMKLFFQTLGRLTHTSSQIPASLLYGHEQEGRRTAQRFEWLDQRQAWLDQRQAWLQQRQAWIEARLVDPHPQQEWLAEQLAWIEQEWEEVNHQQRKLFDLRRWLARYQSRIDEGEPLPPPFREAQ